MDWNIIRNPINSHLKAKTIKRSNCCCKEIFSIETLKTSKKKKKKERERERKLILKVFLLARTVCSTVTNPKLYSAEHF